MDHLNTLGDFKDCMHRHGEVMFRWHGKEYSITHYDGHISISEPYKQETESLFPSVDELLQYSLDNKFLRDIICQVEVITRTI